MSKCDYSSFKDWMILFLCMAILSRLGGCMGPSYQPKETLERIEQKLDKLLEEKT